eukprot:GHVT01061933.1.p1 GENE.GHVT01061933.1~~GHVT01061933.1.p1  ORF type:complete len:426 (-),score=15.41 GHVT01061933.1:2756-4033(-)
MLLSAVYILQHRTRIAILPVVREFSNPMPLCATLSKEFARGEGLLRTSRSCYQQTHPKDIFLTRCTPPVDPSASQSCNWADDGKDLIVGLHVKHHINSLHSGAATCKTCRAGDGAPPNGSTPNSQLSCTTANQDSSSSILSVASIANSADSVSFRNTTSVAQDSNEMAHGEGVLNSITSRPGILNPTPNIEIDHHTLGKGRTLEIDPRVHSLHDPAMLSIPLLSEFPSGSSCGEIRPKQASFIDHKRVASSVNCATNVSEQDYSSNRNVENDPHTHLRFVSMQNTDTALVEGSMKRLVSNSLPSNRMHSFHNASSNEFYPPKRPSSELLESMSAYATKCSTPIPDCDVANDINNRLEFKRDLNVSSYEDFDIDTSYNDVDIFPPIPEPDQLPTGDTKDRESNCEANADTELLTTANPRIKGRICL